MKTTTLKLQTENTNHQPTLPRRSRKTPPMGDVSISPYISPKELAFRWRCGRSTVDRITSRAGMTKLFLGEGKNGIVRYLVKEVEAYEASRQVVMQARTSKK